MPSSDAAPILASDQVTHHQHEQLVAYLQDLESCAARGDTEQFHLVLNNFGHTMQAHFDREESLLQAVSSHIMLNHRDQHEALIESFAEFCVQLSEALGEERLLRLVAAQLREQFFRHIS
ncbi:MAG: hypothetical protein RIR00_1947, partial [Pseudomonadota bacterium]